MPDQVKVKYVSMITFQTIENTKKICGTVGSLCQLQRMALLVMYDVFAYNKVSTHKMNDILIRSTMYWKPESQTMYA